MVYIRLFPNEVVISGVNNDVMEDADTNAPQSKKSKLDELNDILSNSEVENQSKFSILNLIKKEMAFYDEGMS